MTPIGVARAALAYVEAGEKANPGSGQHVKTEHLRTAIIVWFVLTRLIWLVGLVKSAQDAPHNASDNESTYWVFLPIGADVIGLLLVVIMIPAGLIWLCTKGITHGIVAIAKRTKRKEKA